MKLLIRQATISDKFSPYNGSIKDLLITDGIISQIDASIVADGAKIIDGHNLHVSAGWVDIFAHFNDPGYEQNETLASGAAAAVAGGYTHVFAVPNTLPAIDSKTIVEYVIQQSLSLPLNIYPVGAVSKGIEGKELCEMYDMLRSGAIAFSDGLKPVQNAGLLLKALQYVKAINAVVIQVPIDKAIAKSGLMSEGVISTQLGLPGIPSIAEELMLSRDIELVKYTGSKMHFTGISTVKSLQLIKQAKEEGVKVTCSVTPHHLFFCDEDLMGYDTNLKTEPPLRSREDMLALRHGVEEGIVDCIASHHQPQNWDNKTCEFEYAKPGMLSLQTAYAVVNTIFPNISIERLADLLTHNARQIFSLSQHSIKENEAADLTLFERTTPFVLREDIIKSKSKNSPYINRELMGRVIGVIAKDKLYLNS